LGLAGLVGVAVAATAARRSAGWDQVFLIDVTYQLKRIDSDFFSDE
jgi:hypothetical protein